MVVAGIITQLMQITDSFLDSEGYTTHIVSDELDESSITDLPYVYIFAGDAPTIEKVSVDTVSFTRNFYIELYVERETRSQAEDRTVNTSVRDLIEKLILKLWSCGQDLKHNGLGTNNVVSTLISSDSGVGRGFLAKSSYVGSRITLQITYHRRLT